MPTTRSELSKRRIRVVKGAVHLVLFVALGTPAAGVCQASTVRVPDAGTALKIAEPILVDTYGKNRVDYERPFLARLVGEQVWIITGTFVLPRCHRTTDLRDRSVRGRRSRVKASSEGRKGLIDHSWQVKRLS